MDYSPFARLPRELRDHVYDLVLLSPQPIPIIRNDEDHFIVLDTPHKSTALTQTCQQIRQESTKRLYAINAFSIKRYWAAQAAADLHYFLDSVGENNIAALQSVEIETRHGIRATGHNVSVAFIEPMKQMRWTGVRAQRCAITVNLCFIVPIGREKFTCETIVLDVQDLTERWHALNRWLMFKMDLSLWNYEARRGLFAVRGCLRACRKQLKIIK